jgi:hypothetical protein
MANRYLDIKIESGSLPTDVKYYRNVIYPEIPVTQDDIYVIASSWDRMDVFEVYAVHEADDESLINWIKPGSHDATNATSFPWIRNAGYSGAETREYLESNYNPYSDSASVTATGGFGKNSATFGIWFLEDLDDLDNDDE